MILLRPECVCVLTNESIEIGHSSVVIRPAAAGLEDADLREARQLLTERRGERPVSLLFEQRLVCGD